MSNYEKLAMTVVAAGTVFTGVMVKKTYDLLHEYTHRKGWESRHELHRRSEKRAKEQAKRRRLEQKD